MTFPQTAIKVADITSADELLANWQQVLDFLREDQPDAITFIGEAMNLAEQFGGKYFHTKLPADVGGRLEWDELVRRTAELFASDITKTVIAEWASSRGLSEPHFVCCCGIEFGHSLNERIELGFKVQRLPDAIC